ncbi:MAG: phosphatase PAP2 family protein, partial [Actinomycetes bacterium]
MSWEISMLAAVQRRTVGPRTLPVARLLSSAGEHAAAWIAAGLLGAALDGRARPQWVRGLL